MALPILFRIPMKLMGTISNTWDSEETFLGVTWPRWDEDEVPPSSPRSLQHVIGNSISLEDV